MNSICQVLLKTGAFAELEEKFYCLSHYAVVYEKKAKSIKEKKLTIALRKRGQVPENKLR